MLEKSKRYIVVSGMPDGWVRRRFVEGEKRMKVGVIKRKIEDRGFGFISTGDKEYFFHHSQCKTSFDNLAVDDEVQFESEKTDKGDRAKDVEKM